MEETTCKMKEPINVTKINKSTLMAADQNKGIRDNATVDKEVLKIGINKLIIMLKDTETHKKGDVFTIKGLSNAGLNWQLNKGKFIRVGARGYLYDFLRLTKNDAIEETTSEKKEANKLTDVEYKAMLEEVLKLSINKQIVMLEDGETLKKGEVFTIHGQSNTGKTWRLNNGSFVLVDAKGSQYEFLPLTKNDEMEVTTCKMKEPINVIKMNKSTLTAADQNKGIIDNATVDKEVLKLCENKEPTSILKNDTLPKEVLKLSINKQIVMLEDNETHVHTKKGEVFTIKGVSKKGTSLLLNNGKFVLVNAIGSLYDFFTPTKNAEIEITSFEKKVPTDVTKITKDMSLAAHETKDTLNPDSADSTELTQMQNIPPSCHSKNEVVNGNTNIDETEVLKTTLPKEVLKLSINKQIVMLEDNATHVHTKKGEIFTIKGVSQKGRSWLLNNGKFVLVNAIGSLYDFFTPTKNAEIEVTSFEQKEPTDVTKINKDLSLAAHETKGTLNTGSADSTEFTKMQNIPPSCHSKNEVVNGNTNIDETEVLKTISENKEVLKLSINNQIVMLEDNETHVHTQKGEVFTIKGVSKKGTSWLLNNGKFVLVNDMGSLYNFFTPTKDTEIEVTGFEKKESKDVTKINDIGLALHETKGTPNTESVDSTEFTKMQNVVPPSCLSKNAVVNGNTNIDETEVLKTAEAIPVKETIEVNLENIVPELVTSILVAKSKIQEIVSSGRCALDCEGVNLSATGELTLIQAAYVFQGKVRCAIFDVKALCQNSKSDIDVLKPLLEGSVQKVCHDVHMDVAAIKHQFGVTLSNVIDTQLVFEYLSGKMMGGMSDFLRWCEVHDHPNKNQVRRIFDVDATIWGKRPLSPKLIKYAAYDVLCLLSTTEIWMPQLTDNDSDLILIASKSRCHLDPLESHKRMIGFGKLPKVEGEGMHSWELLQALEPNLVNKFAQVEVDENVHDLMAYIPEKFHDFFNASNDKLRDIVFEVGARPYAYYGPQKRVFLNDDPSLVMTLEQMESIISLFEGSFSLDNRAGIDRSLHRISAMRSNTNKVYSLTYRVGRAVYGNAGMMKDVLAQNSKSVLIMGVPGTGKTTIIREVAKQLSEQEFNVIIVDTSNEIAGDGLIPHPSVGMARRMMVPSLDKQAGVLVEAVQNHTPDVIICDEIGRIEEVVAMQTVKERGVRCIASAHGSLRNLVNNRQLNGLVGGVETITVGDLQATKDQHRLGGSFSKVRQQRSGTPVFDVIVELQPKKMDEWTVIADVATAVDRILQGKTFNAQVRRRDPESGLMSLELVQG